MTPAQPIQTQPVQSAQQPAQQPAQSAPSVDNTQSDDSTDASMGAGKTTNLKRAYSRLNEAVTAMLDAAGVKRTATIPHIKGQPMHEHIDAVGKTLAPLGGLTKNLVTVGHSKHGSAQTVAHPMAKMRETVVTKDFQPAIDAIKACQSFISKCKSLLGDVPEIQAAQGQLALVAKTGGEQMTLHDLAVYLLNIPGPVVKAVSRAHSFVKHGRVHPRLTGPNERL